MGTPGAIASRYMINAQSLEEFDQAMEFLRDEEVLSSEQGSVSAVRTILRILEPIKHTMSRSPSATIKIDDFDVVDILRQRHMLNWQDYSIQFLELIPKLQSLNFSMTAREWSVLNDVADALDTHCTHLLRRMGGR